MAVLLTLALSSTGCLTTRQTSFSDKAVRLERVTGVTTRSGRDIRFRLPGASIVNDTMYAVGDKGEMSLPTDSIARVWDQHTSTGRTVGLLAGLAVFGIAIAAVISVGNSIDLGGTF
jgi:hypothetical protein